MSFDPNTQVAHPDPWGTHVPARKPAWREHKRQSDARNAFNNALEASIWEWNTLLSKWTLVTRKAPAPPEPPKPVLRFDSPQQKAVMRVLLDRFSKFEQRKQTHYLINGMSTSHLALHVIDDKETIHAFWPTEAQRHDFRNGNVYMLEDGVITKMQSSVRKEIEKLVTRGYIERMGNEHERRWRPAKHLKGVTL